MNKMNKIQYGLLVLGTALLLNACGGNEQPTWVEAEVRAELGDMQELWDSHGFTQYNVDYRGGSAIFGPNASRWKTLLVLDGVITEARFSDTDEPINEEDFDDRQIQLQTIEQAFALIDSTISERPYELTVTYNAEYGFPEGIAVDRSSNSSEDERNWTYNNFVPIE